MCVCVVKFTRRRLALLPGTPEVSTLEEEFSEWTSAEAQRSSLTGNQVMSIDSAL